MNRAPGLSGPLTRDHILAVHEALMHGQDRADPGRFRGQQVWVGGTDYSPHRDTVVPPQGTRIEASINDRRALSERTDLPLLAQAAIAHAPFETIHPFVDGNGRAGRALVHVMLRHGGDHPHQGQRRNVVWQATEVFEAVDRFSERARRNSRAG